MKAAGKLGKLLGDTFLVKRRKSIVLSFTTPLAPRRALFMARSPSVWVFAAGSFRAWFGVALYVLADEITVPALLLSGRPTESPLLSLGLAAHLVYGATTEVARCGLHGALLN
jgi:hypothetical protein